MPTTRITDVVQGLEKANAGLEPELLSGPDKRRLLDEYLRARRHADFGIAALARELDDAPALAQIAGTSLGKAKETVATGKVLKESPTLSEALRHAEISLDQATEIAKAEESAPGSAETLIEVARKEQFHVLREKARKIKLEAEQHRGLSQRQHESRKARTYSDELGVTHIHLELEPAVGVPIVARAEAEAQRLAREAKRNGNQEPFERHLVDAYAAILSGGGKGRAKRPELVVLVDYEVAKRGWTDVREEGDPQDPGVRSSDPRRLARSPKWPL